VLCYFCQSHCYKIGVGLFFILIFNNLSQSRQFEFFAKITPTITYIHMSQTTESQHPNPGGPRAHETEQLSFAVDVPGDDPRADRREEQHHRHVRLQRRAGRPEAAHHVVGQRRLLQPGTNNEVFLFSDPASPPPWPSIFLTILFLSTTLLSGIFTKQQWSKFHSKTTDLSDICCCNNV
jgi:hypothetical protein